MWKVSVFGFILVRMREHTDQNNSQYEHFLRADLHANIIGHG